MDVNIHIIEPLFAPLALDTFTGGFLYLFLLLLRFLFIAPGGADVVAVNISFFEPVTAVRALDHFGRFRCAVMVAEDVSFFEPFAAVRALDHVIDFGRAVMVAEDDAFFEPVTAVRTADHFGGRGAVFGRADMVAEDDAFLKPVATIRAPDIVVVLCRADMVAENISRFVPVAAVRALYIVGGAGIAHVIVIGGPFSVPVSAVRATDIDGTGFRPPEGEALRHHRHRTGEGHGDILVCGKTAAADIADSRGNHNLLYPGCHEEIVGAQHLQAFRQDSLFQVRQVVDHADVDIFHGFREGDPGHGVPDL